jgi:hypothetical protein
VTTEGGQHLLLIDFKPKNQADPRDAEIVDLGALLKGDLMEAKGTCHRARFSEQLCFEKKALRIFECLLGSADENRQGRLNAFRGLLSTVFSLDIVHCCSGII